MKGFADPPEQEKTASSINVSALLNSIMSSSESRSNESHSNASLRGVNMEGRNVGAAMIMRRNSTSLGVNNEGGGFNIYISNNVQGVNNSVLVGSQVYTGDRPGLSLTLTDRRLDKRSGGRRSDLAMGICVMLVFAILLVYLVIRFI